MELEEKDLKIILFDFSGNEIYRNSHLVPLIERIDKFLFFFNLSQKDSFLEAANLIALIAKNKSE